MKGDIIATFLAIFFGFLLIEVLLGRTRFKGLGWQNHLLDGLSLLQSIAVIGPIISIGSAALAGWIYPSGHNSLIDTPLWLQFVAFLLLDDLVQYWRHRSAHTFKVLWPLHRVIRFSVPAGAGCRHKST